VVRATKRWRKKKPLKTAKAHRSFRKALNDLTRGSVAEEATPIAATRRLGRVKLSKLNDWGVMSLKEFVKSRLVRRACSVGAKKRRAMRSPTGSVL
jgi:hypothetical protein